MRLPVSVEPSTAAGRAAPRRPSCAARMVTLAMGCSMLAGCFTLSPIRLDGDIEPGRVRAHLTEKGVDQVATVIGERRSVLTGQVTSAVGDEIVLLVPSTRTGDGPGTGVLYQELRLPRNDFVAMERRKLDRMRTGLVVGGVAAAAGFLLYNSLSGKTGSSPDGGGGGPAESRVPLMRFVFW